MPRKGRKIEPSIQTLAFTALVPANGTADFYIDLSQAASIVNRRFYRQGINWAVGGFKFLSEPSVATGSLNGSINIQKLPETWVMSNSWEKGFRAWQDMNKNATDETDQQSLSGKFLDFKIYADEGHHQAGFGGNLLPLNSQGLATPGEWIPSEVIIPNSSTPGSSTVFEIIATGGNYPGAGASGRDAVSLINGYANSRALPGIVDPNVPADSDDAAGVTPENWLVGMFNEGTTQDSAVIQNMTEYDQPPYPYENDGVNIDTMYPGGQTQLGGLMIHDVEYTTPTTIGGTTRLKGGMFPCGLVKITCQNNDEEDTLHSILIDLVPGSHRGYLCEPMTDM